MSTVPVYEAKTRLSELLAQASRGEEVTITRHGVPVARLVGPGAGGGPGGFHQLSRHVGADDERRRQVEAAISALLALRQGVTLDLPLHDAIASGRN
jgi:prevent-host-death family protein